MTPVLRRPPATLVAMLTLAAFLLVTTGFATSAAGEKEAPRKRVLIDQIMLERRNVDDLDQAVAQLREQVTAARDDAGRNEAARRQEDLAAQAGTTAVRGPAVVVRLSDAPKDEKNTEPAKSSPSTFGTDRVQDHDIQLVVNALFAAGAQAVAINENRVSAVTPIRAAGGTIVVNYRPVSSPYRIVGIRADRTTFEQATIARNFDQWQSKFKLGYSVQSVKNANVPAYAGRVAIDVAVPAAP